MIYLDVDGALNALGPVGAETWPDFKKHDVSINEGGGLKSVFRLHLSLKMAEALWNVSEGAIMWHTTWNTTGNQSTPLSNKKISPLMGWPSLDYLPYNEVRSSGWWKWTELKQIDHLPDKFVWIDDDLVYENSAQRWTEDNGGLWIAPNPEVGVTPDHIERIATYYDD